MGLPPVGGEFPGDPLHGFIGWEVCGELLGPAAADDGKRPAPLEKHGPHLDFSQIRFNGLGHA